MTRMVLSLLVAVFLSGCAGAPLWTARGPAAFKECKNILCAEASAEPKHGNIGIESVPLREEAAEKRARASLLATMESRITSIMKDYIGPEGELVERALRTIANGAANGAETLDRYTAKGGVVRVLVGINAAKFKKAVEDTPQVQDAARKFMRERTDVLLKEAESK